VKKCNIASISTVLNFSPKIFTVIFHVYVNNSLKKMSENTYILHQWRIRCLNTLRCQMIVALNPPSIIQHKEVSSVLSILSGYRTLHTTQTLSCLLSLIAHPLNSVHLEYFFNPETQCYLVEICHAWNEGLTPAIQCYISVRRNDFLML